METIQECMNEFRKQLERGTIQRAYRSLIEFMLNLKACFNSKYPEYIVSGSIYYGYMDMTYFAFTPKSLKERNLKVAIVFNYEAFRFEIWLAAYNRNIQQKYWKLFQESGWNKYRIVTPAKGVDAIIETYIADDISFNNPEELTSQIENAAVRFIYDVENFLAEQ